MRSTTSPASFAHQILGQSVWVALTLLAAGLGALASVGARSFYEQLELPAWRPPGEVFGIVWTLLYVLMAIAACLVWRRRDERGGREALMLYAAQLVPNALWSWLFFRWRLGQPALWDALLLWCLVAATAAAFWRLHRLAGALLLPYLVWVSFAVVLNTVAWQLNPSLQHAPQRPALHEHPT